MTKLTAHQKAFVARALRNARASIEAQQGEPLDIDQACTIAGLCEAMEISVSEVLPAQSVTLIDPFVIDILAARAVLQ